MNNCFQLLFKALVQQLELKHGIITTVTVTLFVVMGFHHAFMTATMRGQCTGDSYRCIQEEYNEQQNRYDSLFSHYPSKVRHHRLYNYGKDVYNSLPLLTYKNKNQFKHHGNSCHLPERKHLFALYVFSNTIRKVSCI